MRQVLVTVVMLCLMSGSTVAGGPVSDAQVRKEASALVSSIKRCMAVPDGAVEAMAIADIGFKLTNGKLNGKPWIIRNPTTVLEKAMTNAAIRAVRRCAPYPSWLNVTVDATFDPREP